MRVVRAVAAVTLGGALVWACKDFVTNPSGASGRSARQLQLDSAQFVVLDGDTLRVKATVLDQNDSAFDTLPAGVSLTWSSSDRAVATVDSAGLVTGVGPGQAQITATVKTEAGSFGASAAATVIQPLVRLVALAGGGQQDTIGATLPESLTVQALDSAGRGVPAVALQFAVRGGSVSPATVTTGTAGTAKVAWTLPSTVGADSVITTSGLLPDSAAVFVAHTRPGAATSVTVVSGANQSGTVGAALAAPLVVKVADRLGDAIQGDLVTWTVASGGGSVAPESATTNATGQAQTAWTLGSTAGPQSVTATATGVAAPATFTATATASAPASIAASAGNGQSAAAGTDVPVAPAVIVKDASGNPVAGVAVTFAVASGGGSVTGASQTTGATGVATVGSWTLGLVAGANTLTATAAGNGISGNPVTFTATGTGSVSGRLYTWVGGSISGATNWGDGVNWSPDGNPGPSDTVVIPSTSFSPALTSNASVAEVRITGDSLTLNGHTLTVGDSLFMSGSSAGVIVMRNPADSLRVGGNVTWGHGDETGKLTAGVLVVGGNFTQPAGSLTSFVGTGSFKTVLSGTQAQTVSLYYAGGNQSHFQDLEIDGTAALALSGRVAATGNVTIVGPRAVTENDTLYVGGNLSAAPGSGLTLAGLEIGGALSVGGSYNVGVTNFIGTGQTVPVLAYTTVAVTGGAATAAGPLSLGGSLVVSNGGSLKLAGRTSVAGSTTVTAGTLTAGGNVLTVTGSLGVVGTGTLAMTDARDSVIVHGSAAFSGGDETGQLTAGVLSVDGDFTQGPSSSALAFVASGTHKTLLTGIQNQTLSFYYGSNSHFRDLELPGTHTVTMVGRIPVAGNFTMGDGSVSGGDTLVVGGNVAAPSGSCEFGMGGVTVYGSFVMQCSYETGVTNFAGSNQVIPAGVQHYDTLAVTGPGAVTDGAPATLLVRGALLVKGSGALTLRNPVSVQQNVLVSAGSLTLNGQTLVTQDSLTVNGSGVIVMTNAADSLLVSSSVTWGGADETGKLAAGVLAVGANFTQPPAFSGSSFATSGTFKTLLQPYALHVVQMYYAGGALSHFQTLEVGYGARAMLIGRIPVLGDFHMINQDTVIGSDTLVVGGNLAMDSAQTYLAMGGVALAGALQVHGLYGAGVTNFTGTNQVIPTVPVVYDTLEVTGPGAVTQDTVAPVLASGALVIKGSGTLTLHGILTVGKNVTISAGSLALNGHFLVAQDSLTVTGTGVLVMTNPADSLTVRGTATFGGADETGLLSAGFLAVGGDFIQPPAFSANAFATSGTFKTMLYGSGSAQRISFYYPTTSHFQDLDVSATAFGATLASDVVVQGVLTDTASGTAFGLTGNGHALTVGGIDVTTEIFDHVLLRITGPAITALDNATFQDYAATDTQLSVATSGTFAFTGLTFTTTPTTGYYVSASNAGGGLGLTITSNLAPAAAASHTQQVNGATVTWQ